VQTLSQTELVRIPTYAASFFLFPGRSGNLGNTPLVWSFQSAAEGLQRRDLRVDSLIPPIVGSVLVPLVGRFDLAPSIAMPLSLEGMVNSTRADLGGYVLHATLQRRVSQDYSALRRQRPKPQVAGSSVDLRPPALSRVFERPWLGRKWEARDRAGGYAYDYVTGVNTSLIFCALMRTTF